MRAALICLPEFTVDGEAVRILGKSVVQRQLAFAREAGCERVIAFGHGAAPEAIRLRYDAESTGMRFQIISTAHALPGAIGEGDTLLVLQPNLLPEAKAALELLRAEGERVLVVSAGPGTAAGFERIDLDRAFGGAMIIPGRLLQRLSVLPEDAAPVPALLRIALQNRLPEARLSDDLTNDGNWQLIVDQVAAEKREKSWLRDHLGPVPFAAVSRQVAWIVLRNFGARLLEKPLAAWMVLGLAVLLLTGAVTSALFGRAATGLALVGVSVPVVEIFLGLMRLSSAPFGSTKHWPILRYLIDAALFFAATAAIDSLLYREFFPPLMLTGTLILGDRFTWPEWLDWLRDRAVIALALSFVASVGGGEFVIMIFAAALLTANLLFSGRLRH